MQVVGHGREAEARGNLVPRLLYALVLVAVIFRRVDAQFAPDAVTLLSNEGAVLANTWRVGPARIMEDFGGVLGSVQIQNISPKAVEDSRFYAEYFDAAGRLCFTLTFAQGHNFERRTSPFLPGEVRTLYSLTYALGPAVRPREVVLHVMHQRNEQSPAGETEGSTEVLSPALLLGESTSNPPWGKLRLPVAPKGFRGPFVDLVLARVIVGTRGEIEDAAVIQAQTPDLADWFSNFIEHQQFQPATADGVAQESTVLLLVRAIVSRHCVHQTKAPAWDVDWVREYAKSLPMTTVPPVITVYLGPEAESYWDTGFPPDFSVVSIGSGWSISVSDGNQTAKPGRGPGGPALRKVVVPPGSDSCP
jgi:hypothetical protein